MGITTFCVVLLEFHRIAIVLSMLHKLVVNNIIETMGKVFRLFTLLIVFVRSYNRLHKVKEEHMNSELEKEIQKKQEGKKDLSVDDACQIVCKLLLKYDQPPNPTKSDFSTGSAKESKKNKDEEAQRQKRIREMEIGILRRQCDRIFTLSKGSGNNNANENSSSDKNRDDENIKELMDDSDDDFEDTDIQIEYLSSDEIVNYCV